MFGPGKTVQCPATGNETSVNECVLHMADYVVLMDYRNYASNGVDGIYEQLLPTLQSAKNVGGSSRVVIGLETNCDAGPYTYKISFCDKGVDYMRSQQSKTLDLVKQNYPELLPLIADRIQFQIEDVIGYRALLQE